MRNHVPTSTRALTKQSGVFVRATPGSQSLERGMVLLRAFLGGAPNLTNAELAERCALPRSTVSRLTRSLVEGGFLEFDAEQSVYRLAPVYLSLAANYQNAHAAFARVIPLLQQTAKREQVNVGLTVRDGLHVVYLASFREGQGPIKRVVEAGSRARIETFSSGHALIAAMAPAERDPLLVQLAQACGTGWPAERRRIAHSLAQYKRHGHCIVDSVPGLFAMATALRTPDGIWCAIVLTTPQHETQAAAEHHLLPLLRQLTQDMKQVWTVD